jgi:hypothetical protein
MWLIIIVLWAIFDLFMGILCVSSIIKDRQEKEQEKLDKEQENMVYYK